MAQSYLAISYLLNKELVEKIDNTTAKETLVLVTSDHGGVNIAPQNTTYLNEFPQVAKESAVRQGGKRVMPTGSARDVFLQMLKRIS